MWPPSACVDPSRSRLHVRLPYVSGYKRDIGELLRPNRGLKSPVLGSLKKKHHRFGNVLEGGSLRVFFGWSFWFVFFLVSFGFWQFFFFPFFVFVFFLFIYFLLFHVFKNWWTFLKYENNFQTCEIFQIHEHFSNQRTCFQIHAHFSNPWTILKFMNKNPWTFFKLLNILWMREHYKNSWKNQFCEHFLKYTNFFSILWTFSKSRTCFQIQEHFSIPWTIFKFVEFLTIRELSSSLLKKLWIYELY